MRLSEVPEGVFYYAVHGRPDNTFEEIVRRIGGRVQRDHAKGEYSEIPAYTWFVKRPVEVVESTEPTTPTTPKARIAELEAELAKATRPAPAVGQVWRDADGDECVTMNDYSVHGMFAYAYCSGGVVSGLPILETETATYVGIWDGKFNVKEANDET